MQIQTKQNAMPLKNSGPSNILLGVQLQLDKVSYQKALES
jgi:hypothetical protein